MYQRLILSLCFSVSIVSSVLSSYHVEEEMQIPSNFSELPVSEQNAILIRMGILEDPRPQGERQRQTEEADRAFALSLLRGGTTASVRDTSQGREDRLAAERLQREEQERQRQLELRSQEEASRLLIEAMMREEQNQRTAEMARMREAQERQRQLELRSHEEASRLLIETMMREEQEQAERAQREMERRRVELARVQTPPVSVIPEGQSTEAVLTINKGRSGYTISCEINNQMCPLLYDTGATHTTIPFEYCSRLGIDTRQLNFNIPTHTANGDTTSAFAQVGSLKVGQLLTLNNLRVFIARQGSLGAPLFGQDIMEHLTCTTRANVMTLTRNQ